VSVALEAHEIVNGQRRADYGPVEESFETIAAMWSAYLEVGLSAQDVAMLMVLLKVCRYGESRTWDSLVDIAGYADCAGQIDAAQAAALSKLSASYAKLNQVPEFIG
jgi:uncharacterized protein DUF6378